jgi:hypothetical protein
MAKSASRTARTIQILMRIRAALPPRCPHLIAALAALHGVCKIPCFKIVLASYRPFPASPSMMQKHERRRAKVSTMMGKR